MLHTHRDCSRLSGVLRAQGDVSRPVTGAATLHVDTGQLLAKKQQQRRRSEAGASTGTSWSTLSEEIVKRCSRQEQHKVWDVT